MAMKQKRLARILAFSLFAAGMNALGEVAPKPYVLNDFSDGTTRVAPPISKKWDVGGKAVTVVESSGNDNGGECSDADRVSFARIACRTAAMNFGVNFTKSAQGRNGLSSFVRKISYWVKIDADSAKCGLAEGEVFCQFDFPWGGPRLNGITIGQIGYGKWKQVTQTFDPPTSFATATGMICSGPNPREPLSGAFVFYVDDITIYGDALPTDIKKLKVSAPANGKVTITWAAADPGDPRNFDLRGCNVYRNDQLVGNAENSLTCEAGIGDVIRVKATDIFKNETTGLMRTVSDDVTPPGPVSNVGVEGSSDGSGDVKVRWTNPTDKDLGGISIYCGEVLMDRVKSPATECVLKQRRLNALKTYTVVAEDTSGNAAAGVAAAGVAPRDAATIPPGRLVIDDCNENQQYWSGEDKVLTATTPPLFAKEISVKRGYRGAQAALVNTNLTVAQSAKGIEGLVLRAKAVGTSSSSLQVSITDRDPANGNNRSWVFPLSGAYQLDEDWAWVYIPLEKLRKPSADAVFNAANVVSVTFWDGDRAPRIAIAEAAFAYTPDKASRVTPSEIRNVTVLENSHDRSGRVILSWDPPLDGTVKQVNVYEGTKRVGSRQISTPYYRYLKVNASVDAPVILTVKTEGFDGIESRGVQVPVQPTSSPVFTQPVLLPPDKAPRCDWIEAEAAYYTAPYVRIPDDSASAGECIGTNNGDDDPGKQATAEYAFDSRAARQKIWARLKVSAESSIGVAFDGKEASRIPLKKSAEWSWQVLGTTTLAVGEHKLKLIRDGAGVLIDRLCLSENPAYTPSGKGDASEPANHFQFLVETPLYKSLLWIPPQAKQIRGVLLTKLNLSEPQVILNPAIRRACTREALAIIYTAYINEGASLKMVQLLYDGNNQMSDALILDQLDLLAKASGYAELKDAPITSTGHSMSYATGNSLAYWNHERVFSRMPMRSGFGHPTGTRPGDNADYIPLLFVGNIGYDDFIHNGGTFPGFWFGGGVVNNRERGAFFGNVVTADGHLDYSVEDSHLQAMFLQKTARAIVPEGVALNGPIALKKLAPTDGWLTGPAGCLDKPEDKPMPMAQFAGDLMKEHKMWFIDQEMADFAYGYHTSYAKRNGKFQQVMFLDKDKKPFNVFWGEGGGELKRCEILGPNLFRLGKGFWNKVPGNYLTEKVKAGAPVEHSATRSIVRTHTGESAVIRSDAADNFTFSLKLGKIGYVIGNMPYFYQQNYGEDGYVYAQVPLRFWYPKQERKAEQMLTFPPLHDMKVGDQTQKLVATSSAGLTVDYLVVEGPAVIDGDTLVLTDIPPRTKFPIKIRVAATQPGTYAGTLYNTAKPVEQSVILKKD